MITIMRMIMPMPMHTPTLTLTSMGEVGTLPLFVWLSPAFPVGAFAYSHGLEWAVEQGDVTDAQSAEAWIADCLEYGAGRNDAILLKCAFEAALKKERAALREIAELAVALQPSEERRLEATGQGNAFIAAIKSAWWTDTLDTLKTAWDGDVAYPIALGVAAAGHGLALRQTLDAFLLAFVSNIVSAVVRLGPIGQTDGQRIMASLLPRVKAIGAMAEDAMLADLGGAALRADIASMNHETQYTRLFRS
jgi:urease accessory protein